MKTDEELTERLRRASRAVRPPEDPVEGLHRRRGAKRRHERLAAGGVAMVLFVAAVGGSLYALRGGGHGHGHAAGPRGGQSLSLDTGQYFYDRMTLVLPSMGEGSSGGTAVIESWWATDGSGRRTATEDGVDYGLPEQGTWGPGAFPVVDDISGLSSDPATLYQQLQQRGASHGGRRAHIRQCRV